jgi:hypothetical protein
MDAPGTSRIRDLALKVAPEETSSKLALTLLGGDGKAILQDQTIVQVIAYLGQLNKENLEAYLTIDFDPSVTVGQVRSLLDLLLAIEAKNGVRLEPPPKGQFYYRAFFPQASWRDPDLAVGDPWQLTLKMQDGKPVGVLRKINVEQGADPRETSTVVHSPAEATAFLKKHDTRWSHTLFFVVPDDMPYGVVESFATPAHETHPIVYVFKATPEELKPG